MSNHSRREYIDPEIYERCPSRTSRLVPSDSRREPHRILSKIYGRARDICRLPHTYTGNQDSQGLVRSLLDNHRQLSGILPAGDGSSLGHTRLQELFLGSRQLLA